MAGDTITGPFRGFVRLILQDRQWHVEELSYDEDWEDTVLDKAIWRPSFPRFDVPDPAWKKVHLDYPQAEPFPFRAESRRASNRLYEDLIEGHGEAAILDLENLASLHGPTYSWRQLRILAHDREELFWDLEPSELTRRLTAMGHPVLNLRNAPVSTWKLLAHLHDRLPCQQACLSWAEPQPKLASPRQQAILEILKRILERAGCPNLSLCLSHSGELAIQYPGESLARRRPRGCIFEKSGKIWLSVPNPYSGHSQFFDILGNLCAWGDPEGKWLRPLWKAAVIETSRLPPDEDGDS